MRRVRLEAEDDFEGWRAAARALAAARVPAEDVVWQVGEQSTDLFGEDAPLPEGPAPRVPRRFLEMAANAALHREPERFSLLYRLLLRLQSQPHLLEDEADRQLRQLGQLARQVRRDSHKMHAFLRFREVPEGRFVAWFEPEHHILRANAGFFVDRFTNMRWSILTPEGSLHWDGRTLLDGPAARRADAPGADPVEGAWKAYYAAIFNPARVMVDAMLKEMPKKYWRNMPETALVPELIAGARKRELGMIDTAPRRAPASLDSLREEAMGCRRCPLWKPATQTVFGEGPPDAEIMIVGEQPGDQEDLAGRPFVGPAGQLFDRAIAQAGIDRARLYITNSVKHFKFEPRGKRRIHARPDAGEIDACQWWLDQERRMIRPRLLVAMGATALRSLTGRPIPVGQVRGTAVPLPDGGSAWVTVHPSHLLRLPPEADREAEFARFVSDLRQARVSSFGAKGV